MSKVTVWKCDTTGKLFEDQKKYQLHLRKLARNRKIDRRLQFGAAESDAWWTAAYEQELSLDEWRQFVIDNQDRFWAAAAKVRPGDWRPKSRGNQVCPIPELLEFTEFELRWSDSVSNSHSCPHNGVENWGNLENLPKGYPGWRGRVEWIVRWPKEWDGVYLGSDLFDNNKRTRCHTGSGGGGGMNYSKKHGCHVQSFGYDFRLFAADWPGLAKAYAQDQMLKVLSGQHSNLNLSAMSQKYDDSDISILTSIEKSATLVE